MSPYVDFVIHVSDSVHPTVEKASDQAGQAQPDAEPYFPVRIDCPSGQFTGKFRNPFPRRELNAKLREANLVARASAVVRSSERISDVGPVKSLETLQEIRSQLFSSLFLTDPGLTRAYAASISGLPQGRGLRFKIRADPKIQDYTEVMGLPWEFLYDTDERTFLDLRGNTVVVRYLELGKKPEPAKISLPLRILALASQPDGYAPLTLGRELRSLMNIENVKVDALEKSTIESLIETLGRREHQVLHFMGTVAMTTRRARPRLCSKREKAKGERLRATC